MSDLRYAKYVLLINGILPLTLLTWDANQGRLGANPIDFALRTTGFVALIMLAMTLLVTPAARLLNRPGWTRFRRMLGLFSFAYALLHFGIYVVVDRRLDYAEAWHEISMRLYLMFGMAALVMMVPLAVTSTDGWIKRLGSKRWKALHRLTYPLALAAVTHYYLSVKVDVRLPSLYAAVIVGALSWRLMNRFLPLTPPHKNRAKGGVT